MIASRSRFSNKYSSFHAAGQDSDTIIYSALNIHKYIRIQIYTCPGMYLRTYSIQSMVNVEHILWNKTVIIV